MFLLKQCESLIPPLLTSVINTFCRVLSTCQHFMLILQNLIIISCSYSRVNARSHSSALVITVFLESYTGRWVNGRPYFWKLVQRQGTVISKFWKFLRANKPKLKLNYHRLCSWDGMESAAPTNAVFNTK